MKCNTKYTNVVGIAKEYAEEIVQGNLQAVEWPRAAASSASCSTTVASWTNTSAPFAAMRSDLESHVSPRITAQQISPTETSHKIPLPQKLDRLKHL